MGSEDDEPSGGSMVSLLALSLAVIPSRARNLSFATTKARFLAGSE